MSAQTYINALKDLITEADDKEAVKQSIYAHLYAAQTQRRAAPSGVSSKDAEILALVTALENEDENLFEEVCSEF